MGSDGSNTISVTGIGVVVGRALLVHAEKNRTVKTEKKIVKDFFKSKLL